MTALDRFMAKVSPEPNSGCWLWTGAADSDGYGNSWFRGRATRAHRASWILHAGEIPTGLEMDHLCRVRCCVNPKHMELVTREENVRRRERGNIGKPNAAKTYCPNGHPYSPENTYVRRQSVGGGTGRMCRTCHRERAAADRERKAMQG